MVKANLLGKVERPALLIPAEGTQVTSSVISGKEIEIAACSARRERDRCRRKRRWRGPRRGSDRAELCRLRGRFPERCSEGRIRHQKLRRWRSLCRFE